MKRIMLLLPLAATACGDDTRAKLDRCKEGIRAEMAALMEKLKRETAESLKVIEPGKRPDRPESREAVDAMTKFSNDMIKTVPDMFAATMPMIEAQLTALEPTAAGLAQCEMVLAQIRQK
jgi:hypothetical protein